MEKALVKLSLPIKPIRFLAASKLEAEKRIRLKVNSKNKTVKKYFLIEITINRILPSILFHIYANEIKIELNYLQKIIIIFIKLGVLVIIKRCSAEV